MKNLRKFQWSPPQKITIPHLLRPTILWFLLLTLTQAISYFLQGMFQNMYTLKKSYFVFMASHYLNSEMEVTLPLAWDSVRLDKVAVRKSYKKVQCAASLYQSNLLPRHCVLSRDSPARSEFAPLFGTNFLEFKFPHLKWVRMLLTPTKQDYSVDWIIMYCYLAPGWQGESAPKVKAEVGNVRMISDLWFYSQTMWIKDEINLYSTLDT